MTPQHCDHECVCNWWACNVNCDILNDPCRRKNCEHDTRSRPLSSELKKERERVLKELKKDLESRFIASNNQWAKGRNSGLLECCNIIDESLRGEP